MELLLCWCKWRLLLYTLLQVGVWLATRMLRLLRGPENEPGPWPADRVDRRRSKTATNEAVRTDFDCAVGRGRFGSLDGVDSGSKVSQRSRRRTGTGNHGVGASGRQLGEAGSGW